MTRTIGIASVLSYLAGLATIGSLLLLKTAPAEVDPKFKLLDYRALESHEERLQSAHFGTGLVIAEAVRDNDSNELPFEKARYVVVEVVPKSPAARAGILPGDILEYVHGTCTETMTRAQVIEELTRGPYIGSVVRPKVFVSLRRANQDFSLNVDREMLPDPESSLKTVHYRTSIDDRDGYCVVTVRNLDWVYIVKALDENMPELLAYNNVVLDLRACAGNSPAIAAQVATRFMVDEDAKLLHTREWSAEGHIDVTYSQGRGAQSLFRRIDGTAMLTLLPAPKRRFLGNLVVVVDERTSGTAEGLAKLLQKHQRAKVVGTTTAGEARLTSVFRMEGSPHQGVAFTSAELLPDSVNDDRAVQPDHCLSKSEDAVVTAIRVVRDKR